MLVLRCSAAVPPWALSRAAGRPCPLAVRPRPCLVAQSQGRRRCRRHCPDCDAGRGTRAGGARAQGQGNYRQAPVGAHHRGWRRLITLVAPPASPRRRHAVVALGRSRHCHQFAPRARTRPIPRAHEAQGQSSWPITPFRSCADPLSSARTTCLSSAT
jgi:hypothetical protein